MSHSLIPLSFTIVQTGFFWEDEVLTKRAQGLFNGLPLEDSKVVFIDCGPISSSRSQYNLEGFRALGSTLTLGAEEYCLFTKKAVPLLVEGLRKTLRVKGPTPIVALAVKKSVAVKTFAHALTEEALHIDEEEASLSILQPK